MADPDLAALEADPELATIFLSETFDHLSSLEASVLTLEASPEDRKALNDVFRPFHTIKAGAGALGLAASKSSRTGSRICWIALVSGSIAFALPRSSSFSRRSIC